MKGKISLIWRVAVALVLVLSFSLVAAVPAVADSPAETDVGFEFCIGDGDTAEWSTTMADKTDAMGDYSVKLDTTSAASHTYVEFIPVPGTTLADLASASDWGYWYYYVQATLSGGPNVELRFTMPVGYDPTSDTGHVDLNVQAGARGADNPSGNLISSVWHEEDLIVNNTVQYYGNDPTDGTGFSYETDGSPSTRKTLADVLALINEETEMTAADPNDTADDWELTRVRIEICPGASRTFYIDDITIDGTTYSFEPIFLDAEYYSVGDTVVVTVPNFAANTNSFRINPWGDEVLTTGVPLAEWTVTAKSSSDPLVEITVALEETGANTGVFTASFGTSGTPPVAEDEVYVEDGDTITITYTTSDPYWGAGASTTIITASVDDTAPTITGLTPADGATEETATPEIGASYSDPAGIDETSVEMLVDGVDVTDDATVNGSLSYTPTEDMVEGSHDVTVSVSDNAGNEASESWSFRIVSWLEGSPVDVEDDYELDELGTVGAAVSITPETVTAEIRVGRYASNPEPEAALTFTMIENGFFDVKVTGAEDATLIVIKFADDNITADSVAYFWGDVEQEWIACDDQGTTADYLWVKVRTTTIPSIAELGGTPFAISTEEVAPFDPWIYDEDDDGVIDIGEVLTAISDYFAEEITIANVLEVITLYF